MFIGKMVLKFIDLKSHKFCGFFWHYLSVQQKIFFDFCGVLFENRHVKAM